MLKDKTLELTTGKEINNNKRELKIDLIKAFLVLGMIFSHSLDFFINRTYISNIVGNFLNLVSFPGFLFVFGYNSYNAYIKNEKRNINKKIVKKIIKLILCYYISGYIYIFLINENYKYIDYIKILFFLKPAGYSEFLLTFALIYLLVLLCRKQLRIISEKDIYMIICIIISIVFILIEPIKKEIPFSYLFLKTNIMSFPLLPYFNIFIIGMYFAKNKPIFNSKVCIILYGMLCYYVIMSSEHLAIRYPVNIAYISGSYVFIYIYYYIFDFIENKFKNKKLLTKIAFIRKK